MRGREVRSYGEERLPFRGLYRTPCASCSRGLVRADRLGFSHVLARRRQRGQGLLRRCRARRRRLRGATHGRCGRLERRRRGRRRRGLRFRMSSRAPRSVLALRCMTVGRRARVRCGCRGRGRSRACRRRLRVGVGRKNGGEDEGAEHGDETHAGNDRRRRRRRESFRGGSSSSILTSKTKSTRAYAPRAKSRSR